MNNSLYIVVPAYNESENIERLIEDWYPIIQAHDGKGESRLVIIDDGSKDNTYQIVKKCAETRPLLIPLTKPNGGHGSTVLYGYRYAIKNHSDYIFQTDSDGQTLPSEFEQFWNLREKYDAIIGDRKNRQDGASRKFVEKVLICILKVIFHVNIPDSNAPFRLMKTELVERYLGLMPQDYNLPNVMLTTFFAYYKERIKFISITFKPRQGGINSINIRKIVKIGWKALKDFGEIHKKMQKRTI